jgi:hypothetical protein
MTLGASLVLGAGCTSAADSDSDAWPAGELRLVSFDSCDQAAEQLRAAARDHVGPWGFEAAAGRVLARDAAGAAGRADGPVAAEAAPGLAAPDAAPVAPTQADGTAPGHSGTNVHEAGVDEPDLVKTDGRRIVTVSRGVLRVVDAVRRVETGRLDLRERVPEGHELGWWQPADLLLHGDHALVLFGAGWWGGMPLPIDPEPPRTEAGRPAGVDDGEGAGGEPRAGAGSSVAREPGAGSPPDRGPTAPPPGKPAAEPRPGPDIDPPAGPAVDPPAGPVVDPPPAPRLPTPMPIVGPRLLLVDLTGAPRVLGEYRVDGDLVDARAVGQTARVVVRSTPRLAFPQPDGAVDEAARLAANREVLDTAELTDWLPRYQVTSGGETDTGQVECTAMSRPAAFTGTSMLTVLTFDLAASALGDGDPVTVVADGDTVYSNGTSLYIASDQRWRAVPDASGAIPAADDRTEIYKFDLSGPGAPRYVAAGSVTGGLVNQYAMSEWEGHLRVATTSGLVRGEVADFESTVYILAERDGKLVETGSVGGLGRTERIHSVRFTGPVGYVVTFRQTDPLYTLDLRDPTAPAVLGELKITGYSAYLHPLGDGRLIGVGQEADRQGRTLGTQVSLFDVSDLAEPALLATHHVAFGHSEAEFDPHAFLWWPDERLLVVPLTVTAWDRATAPQAGALVLRVEAAGFTELDLVTHPVSGRWDGGGQIRRALVVADTLWTLSDLGLQANALSTLEEIAWIPLA